MHPESDDGGKYHTGNFHSLGFEPATTTLITTSLSRGVGIGVSIISKASIELCIITCLGIAVDDISQAWDALPVD